MPTDRRVSCLLCAGRCDPDRYLCRRCHERMMSAELARLVDEVTQVTAVTQEPESPQ